MRVQRFNEDGIVMQGFPFQPEQASSIARSVDYLYFFITAVTVFFTTVIFAVIFFFMIKYRRRSPGERPKAIEGSLPLEVLWTAIPTLIVAVIFVWSATLYFHHAEAILDRKSTRLNSSHLGI